MIETKRLVLRPVQEEDESDIFEYSRNKNVGPNAGWKPHESVEETRAVMKEIFLGKRDVFGMILRENDRLIGTIGLVEDDKRQYDGVKMLGYALAEPYWGRGLMTEAARAVAEYGLSRYCAISAYCYTQNRRSQRVLEKCGLNTGLEIPFLEFERLVSEKILLAGKGREICGDCQWAYICHK